MLLTTGGRGADFAALLDREREAVVPHQHDLLFAAVQLLDAAVVVVVALLRTVDLDSSSDSGINRRLLADVVVVVDVVPVFSIGCSRSGVWKKRESQKNEVDQLIWSLEMMTATAGKKGVRGR